MSKTDKSSTGDLSGVHPYLHKLVGQEVKKSKITRTKDKQVKITIYQKRV